MWTGKDTELHWGEDTTHENVFRCSYFESKTKPSAAKAQKKTYTGRGGHHTYFLDWVTNWGEEGGGTTHSFLMRGTIGVGTPNNIERQVGPTPESNSILKYIFNPKRV